MSKSYKINPTLTGSFAVFVWGLALPVARYVESEIGVLAYIGILFSTTAVLGFATHLLRGEPLLPKGVFKNKFLYARWIFFLGNMPSIMTAVMIVQKKYVPFVILLNYLWPTTTILFSIIFAGVSIRKRPIFIAGIFLVIAALAIEVLQPETLDANLFSKPRDCLGYALAIIAALSWGAYSAITRRAGHETGGSRVIPMFQMVLALALPASFMPDAASWNHMTLGITAIMAIWSFLQFGAFQAWDFGMRYGNIVILSLCADFIPWLVLITSQLLLGVDIGNKTMMSAILLVIGAMTVRYGTVLVPVKAPANPDVTLTPPESLD